MSRLLYWAGCRGPGAVYCMLVALASAASLAYAAGVQAGVYAAAILASSVVALVSTGSTVAPAAWLALSSLLLLAAGPGALPARYASLALLAAAALWAAAARRPEVAYAGLAAGAFGDPATAAAAVVASGVAGLLSTRRLHASLALALVAPLVYYSTPAAAAMASSSLALALVAAAGGPAGLRGCPVRTDSALAVPALSIAAVGFALELAGSSYWASLVWPMGFMLQASSILTPEPAFFGSSSLSPEGEKRLPDGS